MKKNAVFFSLLGVLAIIFIVAQCSRDQKNPMESNKIIATTQDEVVTLATCADADPSSPVGIVPTLVAGNTPGETAYNVKIDPPNAGTYALGTGSVTISFSNGDCGEVMTWSVSDNIVIDHVYAKGAPAYNDYDYTGKSPHPTTDGNIHCPIAGGSGKYAEFSHVSFVFHYKLTVSKTAVPEYTRTYDWTIDKVGDKTALELSVGQTFTVNYAVTVGATFTDSDWKVTGTIIIFNNTPLEAVITSISDVADGVTATVDCSLPYTLAAGATLNCTYTANLTGAINGTNTVTVVTSTPLVEGGTATKAYTFGAPTTEFDECIDVKDDQKGALGSVCYGTAPHTFNYPLNIVYNECGEFDFVNVACFVTNDNGVTGSDSWTVVVTVPCAGGCTLTQGYWKTHSSKGPAPYDDTWAQLPNGADTPFFLSGQSYYQVLWTPPSGGNAYYILAHQYIAAKLNGLNGADLSAVQDALKDAEALLIANTPAGIATLKGKAKAEWTNLASILDSYNNGYIGPGHCSE